MQTNIDLITLTLSMTNLPALEIALIMDLTHRTKKMPINLFDFYAYTSPIDSA